MYSIYRILFSPAHKNLGTFFVHILYSITSICKETNTAKNIILKDETKIKNNHMYRQ